MSLRDKIAQVMGVLRSKEPESKEYLDNELNLKPQVQESQVNDVLEDDQQDKNYDVIYMELDWDDELSMEKLMDKSNSHYRICEDEKIMRR